MHTTEYPSLVNITHIIDEKVFCWFQVKWNSCRFYRDYDDHMFIEEAQKQLAKMKCLEYADEFKDVWFCSFIKKWKLQDLVAIFCNDCEGNEMEPNNYPIKLIGRSLICPLCIANEFDKFERKRFGDDRNSVTVEYNKLQIIEKIRNNVLYGSESETDTNIDDIIGGTKRKNVDWKKMMRMKIQIKKANWMKEAYYQRLVVKLQR